MECLQGAFEAYKVNIFMISSGGKELSLFSRLISVQLGAAVSLLRIAKQKTR